MVARAHRVPDESRGKRLDQELARAFPDLTRSRLQALIEQGHVLLNDKPAKAALRLKGGEAIRLEVPAAEPIALRPEALPLRVLHEDRDLLVIDKDPGVIVHPGAGHSGGTLVNAILHHVKDLQGIGGELRPGIVHRLDKDTSGCLVIAKNEWTLAKLQAAFKAREVEKTYLAIAVGEPPEQQRIETLYGRHPVHRQRFTGKVKTGKRAITEWRVVERFPGAALIEVNLLTGRTHQIRVHLSEAGFPLLGDALYGRRKLPAALEPAGKALGRQALHAWKLGFAHPRTGRKMTFVALRPKAFEAAVMLLRGGLPEQG